MLGPRIWLHGSHSFYGKPKSDEHCVSIIKSCMSHGINMFDTAEAYAIRVDDGKILHNESVLGKAIASIGRDKMVICTKHSRVRAGLSAEQLRSSIRSSCTKSLKRLGIQTIDLYYLHRMYPDQDIEDVMGCFKELIDGNTVRWFVKPPLVHTTAHSVTPISCPTRMGVGDLEERWSSGHLSPIRHWNSAVFSCNVWFVWSVQFGRPQGWRSTVPYLKQENLMQNVVVAKRIDMASAKELTLAQLSLAWVMNQVDVVPIPGTTVLDT